MKESSQTMLAPELSSAPKSGDKKPLRTTELTPKEKEQIEVVRKKRELAREGIGFVPAAPVVPADIKERRLLRALSGGETIDA